MSSSSSGRGAVRVSVARRRWLGAAAAAGGGAALAGCGFRLRRAPVLPFRSIALTGFRPGSPLEAELRRTILQSGDVRVVDAVSQADVVLDALADVREKAVVAATSAGQVRELELRTRFGFRVVTPAGKVLIAPTELLQTRELSYTETLALAKELEEQQLYRSMQSDLVEQVMRRLAAVDLS